MDKVEDLPLEENIVSGKYSTVSSVSAQRVGKDTLILKPHLVSPETGCEHPIINGRFRGRAYRYAYVVGLFESVNGGAFANALVKVDMETGSTAAAWRGDEFQHPSEAAFVARDGGEEDDGILVASVTDVRPNERDFLVFIDARNMTEVARANFDDDIPMSSHAYVIPQS